MRSGYDARSGIYESGTDEDEKENCIQKCRRLQLEMDELLNEVNDLNADSAVSKEKRESYEAIGSVVNNAKKVLGSLQLEKVFGAETTKATADTEMKKLLSQIDEYKKSGVTVPITNASSELVATTRIAELENKLHNIETVIGAQPEKMNRLSLALHSNNLLDAVQKISATAALLQPTHLDVIETRIGNLASKMDAIAVSSKNAASDGNVDQRIIELYELAKRTEPVAQLLPSMLQRMQALENLHNYGKCSNQSFPKRLKKVKMFFFCFFFSQQQQTLVKLSLNWKPHKHHYQLVWPVTRPCYKMCRKRLL